jgi:transcriptional regulator with XRE-family HTH domain
MTSPTRKFIGGRIKAYRKDKGITQAVVADALGCEITTVSRYERGDTTPDSEQLLVLAELLAVTPMELLPGEPDLRWSTVVDLRALLLELIYAIKDPDALHQLIEMARKLKEKC